MFTILPFGSARADRVWPEASPLAFGIVAAIAVGLTASALVQTTRRAVRGPATAAVRA
jgi:putative ABC transport system permease protein